MDGPDELARLPTDAAYSGHRIDLRHETARDRVAEAVFRKIATATDAEAAHLFLAPGAWSPIRLRTRRARWPEGGEERDGLTTNAHASPAGTKMQHRETRATG